ncbi:MAG TPA: phosphatase PAP2 family protein [Candidatus Acidoferrum sp.]|nr:phosphatase PAP2 family protein [Candidatus Acidoferrum sp.]
MNISTNAVSKFSPRLFALCLALSGSLLTTVASNGQEVAAPRQQAPASASASYLAADAVDFTSLLPPPPAAGSPEEKRDLDALHAAQDARNEAMTARVQADANVNLFRFADVMGDKFTEQNLPRTVAFFRNVSRSIGSSTGSLKDCWARPRPFLLDPTITPPAGLKESARMRSSSEIPIVKNPRCLQGTMKSDYSYSYPSGHSMYGAMTAMLLGDMVPERSGVILTRGWEYGYNRVLGGVHYPSDVEAGRVQAAVLVALMKTNADFQRDFAAARSELRRVLGYQ